MAVSALRKRDESKRRHGDCCARPHRFCRQCSRRLVTKETVGLESQPGFEILFSGFLAMLGEMSRTSELYLDLLFCAHSCAEGQLDRAWEGILSATRHHEDRSALSLPSLGYGCPFTVCGPRVKGLQNELVLECQCSYSSKCFYGEGSSK